MGIKRAVSIAIALSAASFAAHACTAVLVGKSASTTGRVIVGHNEDDDGDITVFHGWFPARDWPEGSVLSAEKRCAAIPQVPHTLGFFMSEPRTAAGSVPNAAMFFNECGVLVTTDNAGPSKEDTSDSSRLTDGGIHRNLRRCVGERARSARDAVRIIGELVERYGYVPSGRIYIVADANEAWQVQVVSGRHYVAKRCPDDAICVVPNHYTIHAIPEKPTADCVFSPDIVSYAVEKGWWEAGKPFDFALAYQSPKWVAIPHNTHRQEYVTSSLLGREWKDATYPFCVKAARKVSPEAVMKALSSHPGGVTPHKDDWASPSACRAATCESFVCDFGATPDKTVLHVAGQPPCEKPYGRLEPCRFAQLQQEKSNRQGGKE